MTTKFGWCSLNLEVGDQVWFHDETDGWSRGRITEFQWDKYPRIAFIDWEDGTENSGIFEDELTTGDPFDEESWAEFG